MVTSKILNPERLKKIKGNRDTLASRVTSQSFSSSLATSFHDKFALKLSAVERG